MPVPLFLAEIMSHTVRTENRSSFNSRLSDRESQFDFKGMLLCSSMTYFFGSSYWKTRKKQTIRKVFELPHGLCVTEMVWTIREDRCVI